MEQKQCESKSRQLESRFEQISLKAFWKQSTPEI